MLNKVFALVLISANVNVVSEVSWTQYPIWSEVEVRELLSKETFITLLTSKVELLESFNLSPYCSTAEKLEFNVTTPAVEGSTIFPLTTPSLSPYPPSTNLSLTVSAIPLLPS